MSGESGPIIRERRNKIRTAQTPKSPEYRKCVENDRVEREEVVLWRAPFSTLLNFAAELVSLLLHCFQRLCVHRVRCFLALTVIALLYFSFTTWGAQSSFVLEWQEQIVWGLWWVWLGILSSVGLGTGLHTFLLFLGPFIAKVTLAAYECGTTDFPSPPYPAEVVCPESASGSTVSLWAIVAKVRFPAFCWGAGTALGELPPYFMARAARLSGSRDEDDEDLQDFEDLLAAKKDSSTSKDGLVDLDLMTRGKLFMHDLVQRVGFFGILAAASIPNPLFDLAGITCGHFLVPFWTFFGATLIGKAVVKMHIQKLFIIFLFSKQYVDIFLSALQSVPLFGVKLHGPLVTFFDKQRSKLHSGSSDDGGNPIGQVFEVFIVVMVSYFIVTIVNSLAQQRVARHQKEARQAKFNSNKSE